MVKQHVKEEEEELFPEVESAEMDLDALGKGAWGTQGRADIENGGIMPPGAPLSNGSSIRR